MDDLCPRCGHDWHGLRCQHTSLVHGLVIHADRCTCPSSLAQAS